MHPKSARLAAAMACQSSSLAKLLLQVIPMLEEVCFKRQDGAADPLYHVSDGWVDLREVAHLLQGSTEGSIGLPMQMNTCDLVSLNTEHRKMRLSQLRSITGREGTPSDPFILKFFNSPNQRSGGGTLLCRLAILVPRGGNPSCAARHLCA